MNTKKLGKWLGFAFILLMVIILRTCTRGEGNKNPAKSTTAKLVVTSIVTETNVISDSEWFTVEYPLRVELLPEYRHLQILLLINDDTNRLHIVPSLSGEDVKYGNGARFGRIALRPGQGPWKQAKVRTERAIVN